MAILSQAKKLGSQPQGQHQMPQNYQTWQKYSPGSILKAAVYSKLPYLSILEWKPDQGMG